MYTQVEPDICKGETFRETFLEPNCECCGSEDHAMLARSTNPHDRTGFKYICPVAIYKRLDKNFPRYPINLDFYACPTKFAEIHHYMNDERLTISLEKYRMMSAAKVDYSYSQNFVDEVIRLCEEYHSSLNFKRSRLSNSDDEEDEASYQEEISTKNEENETNSPEQRSSQQICGKREG